LKTGGRRMGRFYTADGENGRWGGRRGARGRKAKKGIGRWEDDKLPDTTVSGRWWQSGRQDKAILTTTAAQPASPPGGFILPDGYYEDGMGPCATTSLGRGLLPACLARGANLQQSTPTAAPYSHPRAPSMVNRHQALAVRYSQQTTRASRTRLASSLPCIHYCRCPSPLATRWRNHGLAAVYGADIPINIHERRFLRLYSLVSRQPSSPRGSRAAAHITTYPSDGSNVFSS